MPHEQTKILFACIHNAGRSQMAAAFFNKHKTKDNIIGISAGTDPASKVHDNVVEAMLAVDCDLRNLKPQKLTPELAATVSVIVTMGCGEACPYVPGVRIVDWLIPDPKHSDQGTTLAIRDDIERRIKAFIQENDY
ncbi:phosphotyrosine protein phosphatase I superfamily [Gongronella butleri]|nr:phosphotyrosine protein phosphatase I superfamily [Gongronella butleri]